jgi:hypothetical protein
MINKIVRRRFFTEDNTIADANRNVTGIGPDASDSSLTDLKSQITSEIDTPKILPHQFQSSVIIPQIANYIVELKNLSDKISDYGKSDMASESKKMIAGKLIDRINKINAIFAQDVIKYLDKLSF